MSIETAALILALLWGPTALWLIFRAVKGPDSRRKDSFADEPASRQRSNMAAQALLLEHWVCKDCRSVNHKNAKRCYSCGVDRAAAPVPPPAPDPLPTGNGWVPVMEAASDTHATEAAAATVRLMSNSHTPDPLVPPPTVEPVPAAAIAATGALATKRPRIRRRSGAAAEPLVIAGPAAVAANPVVADPEPEPEIVPAAAVVASTASATKRPRIRRRNPAATEPLVIADASVAAHTTAVAPEPIVTVPELEPDMVPAAPVVTSTAPAARRPRANRRNGAAAEPLVLAEASALAAPAAAATPVTVDPEPPVVAATAPVPDIPVPLAPAPDATRRVSASVPAVCPFLGFKDDQTTRCDYPDARNLCHAAAVGAGSSRANRRFGRGHGGRTVSISPDLQATLCLTPNHQECKRYPKVPTP